MIDFATLPIGSIVSNKKKREEKSRWTTLSKEKSVLREVRVRIVRERAYRHDWLSPSLFTEDPFDSPVMGYFAVTLTLDRQKSFYGGEHPKHEKIIAGPVRKIDKEVCNRRKKNPEVASIDFVGQLDLHADAYPHAHFMFVIKSTEDKKILDSVADWWTEYHGHVDIQKIKSKTDVAKWMHYLFRDQPWHKSPPKITVSLHKNLGVARTKGIPRINEITMVVPEDDPEPPKPTRIPDVVLCDETMYSISAPSVQISAKKLAELQESSNVTQLLRYSNFGPFVVFGAWLKAAIRLVEHHGSKQVLVDRLTAPGLVQAYVRIWGYSKARALRYLNRQATRIDREWAWKAVETLVELGYRVGFRLETTKGNRTEWDRDLLTLQGIRALTCCELRTRIESRVA